MMHWREISFERCCNYAKSAAIFKKPEEAKLSMSVNSDHARRSRTLMWEAVAPIQLTERHELELPEKCGFGQNGNIAASNTENEQ